MSDKNTVFNKKYSINAKGILLDLSKPIVMGILNSTPDSFFAGSRIDSIKTGLSTAEQMLIDGATILDLGAYSSRPGAVHISETEELNRLIPLVEALAKEYPEAILSIDTFRAKVAEASINAGAHIINDISGGTLDENMFETVGRLKVPYILMHMKGTPQTMTKLNTYQELVPDIMRYFGERINMLRMHNVNDIILDPGFGFAKDSNQNMVLLKQTTDIVNLGYPVLAGLSRKRMIWQTLATSAEEALNGTTVLNTIALLNGAKILRVHDVKAAHEAIILTEFVKNAQ